LSIERRIARGEPLVGLKPGFTSTAKMLQMGVDDLIWAHLTDRMAMELIDSRFRSFEFNLADVIADNCSSSGYVVGSWHKPDMDLTALSMRLEPEGVAVRDGSSGAILGNLLELLLHAARFADSAGFGLEPGWIVLAGAATSDATLRAGVRVRTVVERLGTVEPTVGV
ncbi:MAG: fumarylacetoacetate hydrolase family protein, partial [Gammaproteobacteria bacterium]|nr:fumarylacetoacetate hydrolase family protein [Gammaproteobacteria bacterium]